MENLLTGYECLALFTDEVQEKIKTNMVRQAGDKDRRVIVEHRYRSPSEFLYGAFIWEDTPQKHDYWEAICSEYP